jgi:type II secretion system protein I
MGEIMKKGFTLIEVMFAFAIFAAVAISYTTGVGSNLATSALMKDEVILRVLCEQKLNEIILDPPEYAESLTLKEESGTFKNKSDYKWSIKYARIKIPDLSSILGNSGEEESGQDSSGPMKLVFDKLKKNLEEIIWQVEVTVTDKRTDFNYTLSYWPYNYKAKVKLQ